MTRADYPGDVKRGWVCIYFKNDLPIKLLNIFQLSECLAIEVGYENMKCIIVTLYRSPSQNSDEFDSFLSNLERTIDNVFNKDPNLFITLGDFNAKLSSWSSWNSKC